MRRSKQAAQHFAAADKHRGHPTFQRLVWKEIRPDPKEPEGIGHHDEKCLRNGDDVRVAGLRLVLRAFER